MADFSTTYNASEFEQQISHIWNKKKCFHANVNSKKAPFSVVLPPPNITGKLHMGHALNITLQDILIRFKRMKGFETLWLPGVDHATIATESRIVANLKKQNISKQELGREKFLRVAWSWKADLEEQIFNQIKRLGASCDFERKRFTMDDGCKKAVNEFFVRLFNEGLIYQGDRVINWCFNCKTSISDIEVDYKEQDGKFWHLKYYFAEDRNKFLEVATTRPETLFGDVAVAVNPDDERYAGFVGKEVIVPLIGRKIKIIADSYVDMDFGTGVVKITPAHDFNDFEVGQRHGLPIVKVFDSNGNLNEETGAFCGINLKDARKLVVIELEKQGFVEKIVDCVHNVGCCYRCGSVVEPLISKQWFVKMKTLAEPAIEAVKNKTLCFVPSHFTKTYLNWLNSVKDWCISRQLWWGHQIPAWHCENCGKINVSQSAPKKCSNCGSESLVQSSDTLDTWFSAGLWPMSTLGWPNEQADDFKFFFPTNVLVTGYDIIFFWVVRMVVSSLKLTSKVPFAKVLIHGIVRDSQGRKMSKSLGNGVDPLDVIDNVGADALRFVLASNTNAGSDVRWSEEKVLAARNFVNKLWNASRFIFLNVEKCNAISCLNKLPEELEVADLWILLKLKDLVNQVAENIDNFELSVASQKLYDFVWDVFCSWFVEITKIRFLSGEDKAKSAVSILTYVLGVILKLLHPFMPFVTEKINLLMFGEEAEVLAISEWPKLNFDFDLSDGLLFDKVVDVIKKIRNIRTEMKVAAGTKAKVLIETKFVDLFEKCRTYVKNLACASEVVVCNKLENLVSDKTYVKLTTESARVFVQLSDLVDLKEQYKRLIREKKVCEQEIEFYSRKLANKQFLEKAPAKVLQIQKDKLKSAEQKLEKVVKSLNEIPLN